MKKRLKMTFDSKAQLIYMDSVFQVNLDLWKVGSFVLDSRQCQPFKEYKRFLCYRTS